MANLPPLEMAQLEELQPIMAMSEASMGFVPNSMLTMAHMRQLPVAFSLLFGTVMGGDAKTMMNNLASIIPEQNAPEDNLSADLLQLVAYCVSLSAGCRYCQAHTGHNTERMSQDASAQREKRERVLDAESADCFSDAERAAVAMALAAGQLPNEATPEHFKRLAKHYNHRQVTQLVAVVSVFGFLNRWNDTMATALEAQPVEFGNTELASAGWTIGKHV